MTPAIPSTPVPIRLALALALAAFVGAAGAYPSSAESASPPPTIATFSAVAYDPNTGEVGVAVQSRFFAVGSVVPYAKAGVGAVATQAYGYAEYATRGLELMARGASPEEAIGIIGRTDTNRNQRQVGMVTVAGHGEAATFTGTECLNWAGGKTGTAPDGLVFTVQGNILTGPEVVDAMARALAEGTVPPGARLTGEEKKATARHDLAGRLVLALLAGQSQGGDSRGMQSAALLVCQAGAGYGGYTDRKYDLRVDDAKDPFDELARILNLARPIALANEAYQVLYAGDHSKATEIFRNLTQLEPNNANHHYNLACALSLSGKTDEALDELAVALHLDPKMKDAARTDRDLTPLHGVPRFEKLMNAGPAPVKDSRRRTP